MQRRQNLIPYALEAVPRPGAHEIRVRMPKTGMQTKNAMYAGKTE